MIICVGPNELAGWHLNLLSPAKIGFIYIGGFIRPVPWDHTILLLWLADVVGFLYQQPSDVCLFVSLLGSASVYLGLAIILLGAI